MIRRYRAKPLPPKVVVAIFVVILLILLGVVISAKTDAPVVNDFDSCIAAGNPVAESYPRQCFHNGRGFIEEL